MEGNTRYFKYSMYPKLFARIDQNVGDSFTQLKNYLLTFTGNLATLTSELERIDQEFDQKIKDLEAQRKKEPEDVRSRPTQVGHLFSQQIGKLITQTKAFRYASVKLKSDTIVLIDDLISGYHMRCTQIIDNFSEVVKDYNDCVVEDERYQAAYKKAAQAYIDSRSSQKERTIKKAKADHDKAKAAAIASHDSRFTKAARTSLLLESILTEFEELERYRQSQTQNILNTFAESLFLAGNEFVVGKTELYKSVRAIQPDAEARVFENEEAFRPATADDRYQTFPLPPTVTLVVNPNDLFPEDIRNGRKFVQATQDYKGPVTHLSVLKGEVLLGGEEVNGFVKCQNVNESVGLLPSSILQPYQ